MEKARITGRDSPDHKPVWHLADAGTICTTGLDMMSINLCTRPEAKFAWHGANGCQISPQSAPETVPTAGALRKIMHANGKVERGHTKMRIVIIYTSQTGFTQRYAQWIAQATDADCFDLSEAKKKDLAPYDAVIFGGWACAGKISKIKWFADNVSSWSREGKRLAAFCVGGSPRENPDVDRALSSNFGTPELEGVHLFYCPGGFNYGKMSAPSRLAMKMFVKALKARKNQTPEERQMAETISSSYDISDRKHIEPILKWLHES